MENDITILIGGAAGRGIQTIGALLARVCHNAGLFIFSMDDFESRVRGGHNFHLLRVSDKPVSAPSTTLDILVAIDAKTYKYHRDSVTSKGIILVNDDQNETNVSNIFNIPLELLAKKAGGVISSNTIAAGAVLAIIGAKLKDFELVLKEQFKTKGQKILDLNLKAGKEGFEIGKDIDFFQSFDFEQTEHHNTVMSGAKAAALGALAADCRFFPFYDSVCNRCIPLLTTALFLV